MREIDAVKETIADVLSASPSSERMRFGSIHSDKGLVYENQLLSPSCHLLPSSLSSAAPRQLTGCHYTIFPEGFG